MSNLTCSVELCDNPRHGRVFCSKHLYRWKTYGDPLKVVRPRVSSGLEYFETHTEWQGDCLVWTGQKDSNGYGRITLRDGGYAVAHRYAWERANGAIPPGIRVDHKDCYNPSCIRVDHLRLATVSQNGANRAGAPRHSKSGYRNVTKSGRKWKVVVGGRYLGTFAAIEDAIAAAESGRQEAFGEFAGRG